jgi:dTDP-4-dehydrorhamnose reductase
MDHQNFVIIGAHGQLGTALQAEYPNARAVDSDELDITNFEAVQAFNWNGVSHILNAAAYTNVDAAETDGRATAWKVNAQALANLSQIASERNITLVHISTDYVFDGTTDNHDETEAFAPLSVYGSSKAAGDLLVAQSPRYYILRTSWVIGQGKNFVGTMMSLAERNISPAVVDDQIGRLTFTSELVRGINHLLTTDAPYGTYNLSNSGESASWAAITRQIFSELGRDDLTVTDVSTQEYYKDKTGIAPRPLLSTLNLSKIQATNFESIDWKVDLKKYIQEQTS